MKGVTRGEKEYEVEGCGVLQSLCSRVQKRERGRW